MQVADTQILIDFPDMTLKVLWKVNLKLLSGCLSLFENKANIIKSLIGLENMEVFVAFYGRKVLPDDKIERLRKFFCTSLET